MAVQVVLGDGEEVDGAGGGCLVGIVCHGGFHLSESKVELAKDGLNKAKVDIAGVEGEFMVAGVNGTLKDDINIEESKERTTPIPCTTHSCNGLTDEYVPHKQSSLSSTSAI